MLNILNASPSVGAYASQPFTVDQIDAHPDCDRIWATMRQAHGIIESAVSEAEYDASEAYDSGREDGEREAQEENEKAVTQWVADVRRAYAAKVDLLGSDAARWFIDQIDQLEDLL